jgi:hypothetical protein
MAYSYLARSSTSKDGYSELTVGQDKSVTVEVGWCMRCISHHILPKGDSNGRHTDCTTAVIISPVRTHIMMVLTQDDRH